MIKHTKNIPLEGGACILAASFSTWMLEVNRSAQSIEID
jgi:hypothetical protein